MRSPSAVTLSDLTRSELCASCATPLPPGTRAGRDGARRTATCLTCQRSVPPPPGEQAAPLFHRGRAGAGITRAYERRRQMREDEVGAVHPRLGDGPAVMLYNRRLPGGRGDIDCIAVAPSGVYVVEAHTVKGAVRIEKRLFGQSKLTVSGRNRTRYLNGLDRRVAAVRGALGEEYGDVRVQGAICFLVADLPLHGTVTIRGHLLLYRRALAKRLNAEGPLSDELIGLVARRLGTALPMA